MLLRLLLLNSSGREREREREIEREGLSRYQVTSLHDEKEGIDRSVIGLAQFLKQVCVHSK